jgi:hypothetical protein
VPREKPGGEPHSGNTGQITPGSDLSPHLCVVLERLKKGDRERTR